MEDLHLLLLSPTCLEQKVCGFTVYHFLMCPMFYNILPLRWMYDDLVGRRVGVGCSASSNMAICLNCVCLRHECCPPVKIQDLHVDSGKGLNMILK